MQLWKWFSKEEEPEEDSLRAAVEESKTVIQETIQEAAKTKKRSNELVSVTQGALDTLTRLEEKMEMVKYTLGQIVVFSVALWGIFIGATLLVPHDQLFHYLTPAFMSEIFVIFLVYARGLPDIWRNRDNITPSHLLILGLLLAGIGLITRLGRWYITSEHTSVHSDIEFWIYNIGITFGIWGGLFLLGAARVAVKAINPGTLLVIFLAIFGVLLYLDLANINIIQFQQVP